MEFEGVPWSIEAGSGDGQARDQRDLCEGRPRSAEKAPRAASKAPRHSFIGPWECPCNVGFEEFEKSECIRQQAQSQREQRLVPWFRGVPPKSYTHLSVFPQRGPT